MTTRVAGRGVRERLVPVVGDDDALAGGEPVVLHDVRRTELVERGGRLLGGGADEGAGGRHAGGGHHVLGEGLGPLELGGRAPTGPNAAIPAARTASATPATSGASGPTTTRSTPSETASAATDGPVQRVDVVQRRDRGDARVARGRVHLGDAGVPGQGAGQGVLAAAGADDEGLHGAQARRRVARGTRTPCRRRRR